MELNRLVDEVRGTLQDRDLCEHFRDLPETSECEARRSLPHQRAVLRYFDEHRSQPGAHNVVGNDQLLRKLALLAKEFESKEYFVSR